MHRSKIMTDDEWSNFQQYTFDICKVVFNSSGEAALFVEALNDGKGRAVLLAGPRSAKLESLSPGGWQDYRGGNHRHWILVTGSSSAFDDFGIVEAVIGDVPEAGTSNVYFMDSSAWGQSGRDQRNTRQPYGSH